MKKNNKETLVDKCNRVESNNLFLAAKKANNQMKITSLIKKGSFYFNPSSYNIISTEDYLCIKPIKEYFPKEESYQFVETSRGLSLNIHNSVINRLIHFKEDAKRLMKTK